MKVAFASLYVCALLVSPALGDDATEAVHEGAFLPFTQAPSNQSGVRTFGDYDSARNSTVVESDVQTKLSEKLQLQAALAFEDGTIDPACSAQLSLLDEQNHGIDLVGAFGGAGFGGVF